MKKSCLILIMAILLQIGAFTLTASADSYTLTFDNINFGGRLIARVTGYVGTITGSLVIPDTVGYSQVPVGAIGENAFNNCTGLTSATLSNNIAIIDGYGFGNCPSLKTLTIPGEIILNINSFSGTSIENLIIADGSSQIAGYLFRNWTGLKTLTIPQGVTSIGVQSFLNCTGLTNVVFPASLASVGASAFSGCTAFKTATFPGSFNYGSDSFSAIENVIIADGTTSISRFQFNNWGTLKSVIIPSSVEYIDTAAFQSCSALKTLTIPGDVTLADYSFNATYVENLTISEGSTAINNLQFRGWDSLKTVTIPNGVTNIGEYAFSYCTNITAVTIPATTTNIGNWAFADSYSLKTLTIGGSFTLNEYAFVGGFLPVIENLTIADGSTTINASQFIKWPALKTVTIPNSVTSIGNLAFAECLSLTDVIIPGNVTSIGTCAFAESGLTSVTFLNGTGDVAIGNEAFRGCERLTKAVISANVTSIGYAAFKRCANLQNVIIAVGAEIIGDEAFRECSALTNVVIPDTVTSIGSYAFMGTALPKITISAGLITLGRAPFLNCSNLTSVKFKGNIPVNLEIPFEGTPANLIAYRYDNATGFGQTLHGKTVQIIPYEDIYNYTISGDSTTITSLKDKDYNGNVTIPSTLGGKTITAIGNSAFIGWTGVTGLTIPASVQSIGNNAFSDCTALESIRFLGNAPTLGTTPFANTHASAVVYYYHDSTGFGATFAGRPTQMMYRYDHLYTFTVSEGKAAITGVTAENQVGDLIIPSILGGYPVAAIADLAFSNNSKLTSVTIPDSVTSIGHSAFRGSVNLQSVTIAGGVETIADEAFGGCTALTNVVLPNTLISFGIWVFSGCTALTGVVLPDSLTNIGAYAFARSGVTSITIPAAVTTIGWAPFLECSGLTSVKFKGNIPEYLEIPFQGTPAGLIAYRYYNATGFGQTLHGRPVQIIADEDIYNYTTANSKVTITGLKDKDYGGNVTIPSTLGGNPVVAIGDSAFVNWQAITGLTIPNSVTTIEGSAFRYCRNIQTLKLPDDIKIISAYSFDSLSALTSLTIPNGVTAIGVAAFGGIYLVENVTIPASVTSIGTNAFYWNSNLKNVTFMGNSPAEVGENIFNYIPDGLIIYYNYGATGFAGTLLGRPTLVIGGDTPETSFKISNVSELTYFASGVNSGNNYTGKYFELTSDIDLLSIDDWTPIGSNTKRFEGNFDGKGFEIQNMTINRPTADYIGLFGYAGENAVVKNLGIAENCSIAGKDSTGGVIGLNYGLVDNCYSINSTITGASYVGAVVGNNYGPVENCYNINSTVTGTGTRDAGGVVGWSREPVRGCYNTGTVSATLNAGGIVGYVRYGGVVENCYNEGNVSTTGTNNAGGIVGRLGDVGGSKVINCYNTGSIYSNQHHSGGIVGYNDHANTVIENCYNTGAVSGRNNSMGGISGRNDGSVSNCYNTGTVTGGTAETAVEAAGIVGSNFSTVLNCFNIGNISGREHTGSIVGRNLNENASVSGSYRWEFAVIDGVSPTENDPTGINGGILTAEQLTNAETYVSFAFGTESPWIWDETDNYPKLSGHKDKNGTDTQVCPFDFLPEGTFKIDGVLISYESGSYFVAISSQSNLETTKDTDVFVAVYFEDKLLDIKPYEKGIASGIGINTRFEYSPAITLNDAYTIKAMVWDKDTLYPYCQALDKTVAQIKAPN